MRNSGAKTPLIKSFLIAWVLGVLLGTLVQSQINLYALQNLGVNIPLPIRFETTLHDLGNFSIVYAVIFGCSFAASQAVALLCSRWTSFKWRIYWCTFGAVAGLWVTFKVVDMIAPMPILIAATRTVVGLFSMLAAAAVAGALFSVLSKRGKLTASPILAFVLLTGLLMPAEQTLAQTSKPYRIELLADARHGGHGVQRGAGCRPQLGMSPRKQCASSYKKESGRQAAHAGVKRGVVHLLVRATRAGNSSSRGAGRGAGLRGLGYLRWVITGRANRHGCCTCALCA